MIRPEFFHSQLASHNLDFFAGVPDSLLKSLCAYLSDNISPKKNIIAANEGGAIGLATGYFLSTGKIPVVYMQNSGIGNTINPLLSLTDSEIYNIPILLIIGWRGEPGVHDEPQHIKQGKVTIPLLDTMGIKSEILTDNEEMFPAQLNKAVQYMTETNNAFALIVKKGTFGKYSLQKTEQNDFCLSREDAIKMVSSSISNNAAIISTTGMISRELFESRVTHEKDFLTVGAMGHASQIALGIALNTPERDIFCFDGDGATIMHMGSMSIIGQMNPNNFYHIIFNNGAHDSVGGQPTTGLNIDIPNIAKNCGYKTIFQVDNQSDLQSILNSLSNYECPLLLEIKVKKGARANLGRPTTTPIENKIAFMDFLKK